MLKQINNNFPRITFTGSMIPFLSLVILLIVKLFGADISWTYVIGIPAALYIGEIVILVVLFMLLMRYVNKCTYLYDTMKKEM